VLAIQAFSERFFHALIVCRKMGIHLTQVTTTCCGFALFSLKQDS
jgi:hypothetical protein